MGFCKRSADAVGRRRQPLNALASLGAAGHNGFERWAGVGVFLEPWLGRRATNILWSVAIPATFAQALRGKQRDEPALAFNAGLAIAGSAVHYVEWPWTLRFGFVPWLEEAEGFRPSLLVAYNSILLSWFLAGVASLVLETRREHLGYAAVGVATAPVLLASARHHFQWAREKAEEGDPAFTPDLLSASPRRPMGSDGSAAS